MPTYPMVCDACGLEEEIVQSIHLDLPTLCPRCGENAYRQDFSKPRLASEVVLIDGPPTTVGKQAELNAKKMGKEQVQQKAEEILGPKGMAKRNAPIPFWRKSDKPLDLTTVKDTRKYIETGDKS